MVENLLVLFSGSYKWTVTFSGSTVHAISTAEPVKLRAATSRAESTIFTVSSLGKSNSLGSSHLDHLFLDVNKGTVTRGGSTVLSIRAAVPVHLRATTSGAEGTILAVSSLGNLLGNSHLDHLFLDADKGTVTFSGSTVKSISAAEPVQLRAATSRAKGTVLTVSSLGKSNSLGSSHLHQLFLCSNKWAVTFSGSTVKSISAAKPVHLRAATSRAEGTILTVSSLGNLFGSSHLDQLLLSSNKGTVT